METQNKFSWTFSFGYLFLGLLIGYVSGVTSSEITKTILTTLFAFIGGKMLNDSSKKNHQQLTQMGGILIAFSIAFLIGLNGGIVVRVNQLLSFNNKTAEKGSVTAHDQAKPDTYLRSDYVKRDLESKFRKGEISKDSIVNLFFKQPSK